MLLKELSENQKFVTVEDIELACANLKYTVFMNPTIWQIVSIMGNGNILAKAQYSDHQCIFEPTVKIAIYVDS